MYCSLSWWVLTPKEMRLKLRYVVLRKTFKIFIYVHVSKQTI